MRKIRMSGSVGASGEQSPEATRPRMLLLPHIGDHKAIDRVAAGRAVLVIAPASLNALCIPFREATRPGLLPLPQLAPACYRTKYSMKCSSTCVWR